MSLSLDQVQRIADLARIELAPGEAGQTRDQLNGIFTLIGAPLSVILCWGLPVDIALAVAAETVRGTVRSSEIQYNITVNDRHPHVVHYEYRHGEARYQGSSSIMDPAESFASSPSGRRAATSRGRS